MSIPDACFRYMPPLGVGSSVAFSLNIMHPRLFRSAFGGGTVVVANTLWFNAHLGVGLYLYSRKHIRRQATFHRVMYSVYGAVIYNFGLTLFWATTKLILPDNKLVRCVFGVLSGIAGVAIGKEYLQMVDANISEE